ncbi:MAG TPA: YbaB/EbfC family nucleoid-associated protein [Streptosporangiaceae bacterium]
MLPEWQAHIDELLERYREKRDQLRDLRTAMDDAGATVTTEDEMVTVSMGPHGRLTGLEFNPRVYRKMSPSELAAAVLAAVGEARAQVDGQLRAALAGGADDDVFDPSRLLPERPDDLDAFRDRYGLRPAPGDAR